MIATRFELCQASSRRTTHTAVAQEPSWLGSVQKGCYLFDQPTYKKQRIQLEIGYVVLSGRLVFG